MPPAYLEALKKGINAFLAEQKEASRPKIDLDLSKLGQIRADASVTRDNLLTEEEKALEAEEAKKIAEKENPVQKTEEEDKEMASPQAENDYGLSPLEVSFLLDLVKGEDYQTLLKQNHLFLSVLVDGINDKLFDEIGDTVIDSNGGQCRNHRGLPARLVRNFRNRGSIVEKKKTRAKKNRANRNQLFKRWGRAPHWSALHYRGPQG